MFSSHRTTIPVGRLKNRADCVREFGTCCGNRELPDFVLEGTGIGFLIQLKRRSPLPVLFHLKISLCA